MLKAKYYHDFKGCEHCILIIGDSDGYRKAALHFSELNGGILAPSEYIQFESKNAIGENGFLLTKNECLFFAKICLKLASQNTAAHDYFSIESVPDMEFLVSCKEYNTLP